MLVDANVTPNRFWPEARFATVEGEGHQTYEDVPIIQIFQTPATIRIWKEEYPHGVVIFNELPFPFYAGTIPLPFDNVSEEMNEEKMKVYKEILVQRDAGWPTGTVVFFPE